MLHFNTYPVTSDMGLRESIDAMLGHVAYNGRDFGYLPSVLHEANFQALARDFGELLDATGNSLKLAPRISDSEVLAQLVDTLVNMCNDYPLYDEELYSAIEQERLMEMIEEERTEDMPEAHEIAYALYEIGADIEQSEYGANVSEEDFHAAVELARQGSR